MLLLITFNVLTNLHLEVHENYSSRDERCTGLNHEAGSQETVSVAVSEVHQRGESNERYEDMMEDDQRTAGEELVNFSLGIGNAVLVECGVDQIHRNAIIEEVGDPEDEIVVQDVESLLHDVTRALTVDK